MGNSISSRRFTPERLIHCLNDKLEFDMDLYFLYRRQKRLRSLLAPSSSPLYIPYGNQPAGGFGMVYNDRFWRDFVDTSRKRQRQRQMKRKVRVYRRDVGGNIVPCTPMDSLWWTTYVHPLQGDNEDSHKKFRLKFRVPKDAFWKLVSDLQQSDLFKRWSSGRRDATGVVASPIELLLLGTLRYLGRGWAFDDLEDVTCVSEETHRQFFHRFILWGSTVYYNEMVKFPKTATEAERHTHEFFQAGFPGCVGSCDATHVAMERCYFQQANANTGPKEKGPARTYNITVNHRRRILTSTSGHPARWNDKTLQRFDKRMVELAKGKILSDFEFYLYEKDIRIGSGITIWKRKYKGAWVMVDNGYIHWPTMIPPYKFPGVHDSTKRFSKWLESMRKDVECTFGSLKRRFRLLHAGVRLHGVESTDKIFLTCCALHNMLLDYDGYDKEWETRAPGEDDHDENEVLPNGVQAALAIGRTMSRGTSILSHWTTSSTDLDASQYRQGTPINVYEMDMEEFRQKLVQHHAILFECNQIVWPKRYKGLPDSLGCPSSSTYCKATA